METSVTCPQLFGKFHAGFSGMKTFPVQDGLDRPKQLVLNFSLI